MIKKRKVTPVAAGGQLPANDISTEGPAQHLPALNYLLVREKDRLRSLVHAFAQKFTSIAAEAEQTKVKEEERRREELLQSVSHDMERCLEANNNLVVKLVRDMEEMKCRKKREVEILNAENKTFASKISDLEEEGKKREESMQSATHDMVLTKTCPEVKEDLVVRLVRELKEVKSRKEKELELLTVENKTLASKISALEEGHRYSKQIGDRLRDEVLDEWKEENSTLVAGSEEIEKSVVMEKDLERAQIDELVELKMQRSQLLAKHDIACGMGAFTQLKIDELKSKMTRKNIVDKKRAKYEIRMSNLVGELAKHKSSERRIGDAYRSCNEKCDIKAAEVASMQRELKMKADETVVLRLQLKELVRDMEEMKCRKEKEVELLNAENKTLASKIFALEEGLEDRLRDEVLDGPKKEDSTLGAGSEEIKKHDVMEEKDLGSALIDELVELEMQRSQLLAKHDISHHMGEITIQKMDELERKMSMKNIGGKRRAEYNIQMVNLLGVLDNHKSAEIRIRADYRSCKVKCDIKAAEIASMQRELKMKADEAVDLRLQLKELMKSKQNFELMCNHLQVDLNGLTRESVKMRTLIDYLTAEKASLEKHLETSQEELKDVQRTLMASVNASCSVLSKLKKTAAEAVGHERAQDNCTRGHPPGEILVIHGGVGGDAERPSSLTRLRREVASSSTRTTEGVGNPYNDAVVIKASIENITVHRVLIDSGSSVNVLYKRAFERMRLDPNTLIPPECPQIDSFGDRWEAEGIVILPVTLGDDRGKYTRMTRFHVFDGPDHYNAIFGRPLLNDFQAVVYTYNLTIQFPAGGRQVIIRGDVVSARECYLRAVGVLED